MSELDLIVADRSHVELIFGWRNDPQIVALGRTRSEVTWEEHSAWFDRVVDDRESLVLIVVVDHVPVGQVRFDPLPGRTAEVSIYLLESERGRGLGSRALQRACALAAERLGVEVILAEVRRDNVGGRRFFESLGFDEVDEGMEFVRYRYTIGDGD